MCGHLSPGTHFPFMRKYSFILLLRPSHPGGQSKHSRTTCTWTSMTSSDPGLETQGLCLLGQGHPPDSPLCCRSDTSSPTLPNGAHLPQVQKNFLSGAGGSKQTSPDYPHRLEQFGDCMGVLHACSGWGTEPAFGNFPSPSQRQANPMGHTFLRPNILEA